ncbi:hypothetical protein [Lederbergia citri]|uniref:Lipoprotein n=1 Tax=Lederbergia citri TaxID=2833580 RepID=A0A942TBL9_9BACI|nr:hypothetical protein [Lederbergia citri]MBS4193467.1 hypothetical protein [Lederbergia citri]
MRNCMSWVLLILIVLLSACSSGTGGSKSLSVDDAIKAFEDDGLVVEDVRKMTKDDYGLAPMKAKEGKIFTVPFVCDDCNVRVMSFDKNDDLKQTKEYYDKLGKESAMFFSWTIEHDNILVQLNGDMDEEDYEKYKKSIEGI